MSKKRIKRGRPEAEPGKAFTRRHVVNLTPEMDDALRGWANECGIARLTDAVRVALGQFLREKGKP